MHENDRLSYVSAMRLREDELFVQRMTQELPRNLKSNLSRVDLNLKDAPIRLRCPVDEVCSTPVNPEDPAIEKIRKALTRQSEAGNMDALALPLGLGDHVDHLTVRAAALPFTEASLPSAFYEDLPYAAYPGAPANLETPPPATDERHSPLTAVLCRSDAAVERKQRLILAYASQIDEDTATLVSSFATRYGGAERLWANAAWLAMAESTQLSVPGPDDSAKF